MYHRGGPPKSCDKRSSAGLLNKLFRTVRSAPKEQKTTFSTDSLEMTNDDIFEIAHIPRVDYADLVNTDTLACTTQDREYFALHKMYWNFTPVSVRGSCNSCRRNLARNPDIFSCSLHKNNADIKWLSQLRHPHILLILGVTRPDEKENYQKPIFERIELGSLHWFLYQKKETIPLATCLSFSKQVSEALIFLKYQGIVHCAVSSHAVYLVNHGVVKLANFEHACQCSSTTHLHSMNAKPGSSFGDQNFVDSPPHGQTNSRPLNLMTKEDTIRLSPWVAPEVVVFMQNGGISCTSVTSPANRSAPNESSLDSLPRFISDCSPTPAADAYSFARLLQELLDPSCASRFDPHQTRKTDVNAEVDEMDHSRSLLLRDMRPVVKAALRRDPFKRAPLEKLHSLIVQMFWDFYEMQSSMCSQRQPNFRQWYESFAHLTLHHHQNSSGLEVSSISQEKVSGNTDTEQGKWNFGKAVQFASPSHKRVKSNQKKEVYHAAIHEPQRGVRDMENLSLMLSNIKALDETPSERELEKEDVDKMRHHQVSRRSDHRSTVEGTHSLLPISASSPNVPDSTQTSRSLNNNNNNSNNDSLQPPSSSRTENSCYQNASIMSIRTFSGPVASPSTLTKQQYIELAAIPSGPLGSGRSRPLVPWTEPSAPVPSPSADMLGESLSVEEDLSGLGKERVDKSDGSGNWIRVAQLSSVSEPGSTLRTSRRLWTFLPRHRRRRMKFLIKPASHHTTPTELWMRKSHFSSYLSGVRRPSSSKMAKHFESISSPASPLRHSDLPTSVNGDVCEDPSGMVLPAFPEDSSPASASVYQSFSSNASNSWPPSPSLSVSAEGTLHPSGHQVHSKLPPATQQDPRGSSERTQKCTPSPLHESKSDGCLKWNSTGDSQIQQYPRPCISLSELQSVKAKLIPVHGQKTY